MNDPSAARAALNAFLRGVERRGVVFAEWQGGDADAGDAALAATLRGFGEVAGDVPFAEWPRRFWAMLLAAPGVRGPGVGRAARTDAAPGHLARLGGGPRAALLLRLVAGLAESEAAAVLGVGRPTYRLALQRALPHREDGSPDPDAWRAMSEAAQVALRAVSAERLQRIALLREGRRPKPPRPAAASPETDVRPGWLWPASFAVVALTAAALAATWWWPWPDVATGGQAPRIQVQELPPAAAPASRFDPVLALQTDRDLELLLAQATSGDEAGPDPAFDAWLVVALANEAEAGGNTLAQPPAQAADADESVPEQFDAPR